MARVTEISDKVKNLRGQKRFIKNVPASKPILQLWRTPKNLKAAGRYFYKAIGGQLVKSRVLTPLDRPLFFQLCQLHDNLSELDEGIAERGFIVADKKGSVKKNPEVAVHKDLLNVYLRLAEKFGLSPHDRKKIDLKIDANPSDAMRRYVFGETE